MQVSQVRGEEERGLFSTVHPPHALVVAHPEAVSRVYCSVKFRGAKLHGGGEAHANNMEKWQDGRLLCHLGGSCGLRVGLDRCLDGSEQQRHHRLPCGRALQRGRWLIPDGLIIWR